MRTPRRSSRWWEQDDLATLVDGCALTGLDEVAIEALVKAGVVAAINIGGIRYFRRADLVAIGVERKKSKAD